MSEKQPERLELGDTAVGEEVSLVAKVITVDKENERIEVVFPGGATKWLSFTDGELDLSDGFLLELPTSTLAYKHPGAT
jgi:hypothetical protein